MPDSLPFTEDDNANRLLASSPLALLIGMLLDQQFPMERAFFSPYLLDERMGGLDVDRLAAMDDEQVREVFAGPPALHRFPGSMGKRARDLSRVIVSEYDGTPEKIWTEATHGKDLLRRLEALPGFGKAKSRVFIAILGKRLGVAPTGWEETAADWPSIADVDEFEKIYELRELKRARKAAKKAKG